MGARGASGRYRRKEEGGGLQIDTHEPQAPKVLPSKDSGGATYTPHPNSESGKDTVLKVLPASLPEMRGQSPHKGSGFGVI